MIYGYLLKEDALIDLSNITESESIAMKNYLYETFLITESRGDVLMKQVAEDLKDLSGKVKDGKISEEELKQQIDDLYDKIKIAQEAGGDINTLATVLGILGITVGGTVAAAGGEAGNASALLAGAVVFLLSTIVATAGSKGYDYDKFYQALITFESKCMMMKRKAKKDDNIELEKKADKMIEIIEDFKTRRRREYRYNESTEIVNESDKSEIKINNFRQAVDEMNRTLNNAFTKMKIAGELIYNIMSKCDKITAKNKDKYLNEIIDMGNEGNKKFKEEEILHPQLSGALLEKWSKTFSAKYSPFGMEVRELFEKKLSKFNDEVIEYLNGFYDKLNKLVGLEKKNIAEISNKFYEDLRKKSSVDVADRINNIIASWYNDGLAGYLKFIGNEIAWAKYILKTNKIKRSLRYKLFSKFVK